MPFLAHFGLKYRFTFMYRRNSMGANIITPKRILHSDFNLFFCQIDQVANFSSFLWAQLHDINLKNCMPRYQLD